MKYLYLYEDNTMKEHNLETISEEDLAASAEGLLDIIRFENGRFEQADVTAEEEDLTDEEEEEGVEPKITYDLDWIPV